MATRRAFLSLSVAPLIGCGHPDWHREGYMESVNSLAITPAGDKLVVFGGTYHYVLNPPSALVAALHSSLRPLLAADFKDFEMRTPTDLRGRWTLFVAKGVLEQQQIDLASSLGFVPDSQGRFVLTGTIAGDRFLKSEARLTQVAERTNSTYWISVVEPPQFARDPIFQRSPVASNSNGGLMIGVVLLLPLLLVLNPCITCK